MASYGNCLIANRVEALEFTGRWADAFDVGRSYLETNTVSPNNWMHFMLGLGRVGMRRGEPGVDTDIDRAVELAEGTAEPQWLVMFRLLEAERHWVAGRGRAGRQPPSSRRSTGSAQMGPDGDFVGMAHVWARRFAVPAPEPLAISDLWVAELGGDVTAAVHQWDAMVAPYEAALALGLLPVHGRPGRGSAPARRAGCACRSRPGCDGRCVRPACARCPGWRGRARASTRPG